MIQKALKVAKKFESIDVFQILRALYNLMDVNAIKRVHLNVDMLSINGRFPFDHILCELYIPKLYKLCAFEIN